MPEKKSCVVSVAHSVSHRTRYKVDKRHRTAQNLDRMKEQLEKSPGVHEVHVNHRTGSVVVHHGAGEEAAGALHGILNELMCECVEVAVETMEPELGPFAAILTKLLPVAEGQNSAAADLMMPVSLIALGFFGGLHARAIFAKLPGGVQALAKFVPLA